MSLRLVIFELRTTSKDPALLKLHVQCSAIRLKYLNSVELFDIAAMLFIF
jgi:hypothetical protein